MIATRKGWTWAPAKKPSTAPQQIKADVSARARDLIDSQLKRTHIEPHRKAPSSTTLWIFQQSGTAASSTSSPSTHVQAQMRCHRFSNLVLHGLSIRAAERSTWRTCATQAGGGKYMQISRFRRP